MELHKDVIKCEINASIADIARLLREHQVRHVYVVEDGMLKGIVNGIDINNKIIAENKDFRIMVAKDIMNKVQSVDMKQSLEYAYAIMRNLNTFICPVVDKKRLVGYYKFAEVCEALHKKVHHGE